MSNDRSKPQDLSEDNLSEDNLDDIKGGAGGDMHNARAFSALGRDREDPSDAGASKEPDYLTISIEPEH